MPRKDSQLTPTQLRKQLLLAESDLNRAQMERDLLTLKTGVQSVVRQAKSLGSIATGATSLISVVSAFQRGKSETQEKPASGPAVWIKRIIRGASFASTVWLAFRSRKNSKKETKVP